MEKNPHPCYTNPTEIKNQAFKSMGEDKFQKKKYLINDAARMVGLSQKRIREYEEAGLVKPDRQSRTNNRIYGDDDIERILRIKQLIHEHGFTLAGLKYFSAAVPCWILYGCDEKELCPAYQASQSPCYEIMSAADAAYPEKCRSCSVYMNRALKSFPLFDKPI
jgi:MerR family transcriptional regulator, repressor of the yfmOP operon